MKNAALKCMIKALMHYPLHQLKPPHYASRRESREKPYIFLFSSLFHEFQLKSKHCKVEIIRWDESGHINNEKFSLIQEQEIRICQKCIYKKLAPPQTC